MNHFADPAFVAAEVAYRFERDRVGSSPRRHRRRHPVLTRLLRRTPVARKRPAHPRHV